MIWELLRSVLLIALMIWLARKSSVIRVGLVIVLTLIVLGFFINMLFWVGLSVAVVTVVASLFEKKKGRLK